MAVSNGWITITVEYRHRTREIETRLDGTLPWRILGDETRIARFNDLTNAIYVIVHEIDEYIYWLGRMKENMELALIEEGN